MKERRAQEAGAARRRWAHQRRASGPQSIKRNRHASALEAADTEPVSRFARFERGVALVELAIVMVPLTLVVFAAIDLGRMAQYQNRVINSAREGVAILAVHPGWVASGCTEDRNVTDRARNQNADIATMTSYTVRAYKGSGPFTAANEITGCIGGFPAGVVAGSKVSVVVSVRVDNNSPLSGPFIGSSTVIKRSATATVQG